MEQQHKAAISIVRFWTNYVPSEDGTMRGVDMVAYAPAGRQDRAVTTATVTSLSKLHPEHLAADNPAIAMAWARWRVIEPAYRAWKEGNEIPLDGTPLAAWPGISAEQCEVLKMMGIRTVEAFAEASDGIIGKVNFPSARALQTAARTWLGGADRQRTAAQMANLESENASLKSDLEEMRQIILEMQREQQAKRGPGRPRKETSEEAAA